MGVEKYIKTLDNGVNIIDYKNLPDSAFLDGFKVINAAKARIISKDNYAQFGLKPGDPDVFIREVGLAPRFITRTELTNTFKHSNNRKIKVLFLQYNKDFLVYNYNGAPYKITRLPNKIGVLDNNDNLSIGDYYVIAPVNADGSINRECMTTIDVNTFKHSFKIPNQERMNSIRSRRAKKNGMRQPQPIQQMPPQPNRQPQPMPRQQMQPPRQPQPMQMQQPRQPQPMPRQQMQPQPNRQPQPMQMRQPQPMQTQSANKYRYTALNRLVNSNNELVGFVLGDKQTNSRVNFNMSKVSGLCDMHMIDNISLVNKEDGGKFLRGNGIVIADLPAIKVNN